MGVELNCYYIIKQENGPLEGSPKSKVVCPNCGENLSRVITSLVKQRGKLKAQREQCRKELEKLTGQKVNRWGKR